MSLGAEWEYESRTATAFNEMDILRAAGAEGWELIDLGALKLHFRRPRDPEQRVTWQYARRDGLLGDRVRQEMRIEGWDPVGQYITYHYFKRHAG